MITKKVFNDLAIFMIGFGLVTGILFPVFSYVLGIPLDYVLKPSFIIMCLMAGIFVGLANVIIARRVVGKRIRLLADKMKTVEHIVSNRNSSDNENVCTVEKCSIKVDSEDEIGDSAIAFNALVRALSHSYQTETDIKEFNQAISSNLEIFKLSSIAIEKLIQRTKSNGGMIIIEEHGELEVAASRGIINNESLLKNEVIWRVLKTYKQEIIRFPEDILMNGVLVTYQPKEVLFIPIIYKDIALGVIILATTDTYSDNDLEELKVFVSGMSLALKNALTHTQLQELAANDPLTNIFNRRFGMIRLQEEYSRALRLEQPLGVLMADIDFFKKVNDTYGHLVGDKVLIHIAQIAKQSMREGDIIIRYGGEEFIAILPGASREDTLLVAEKFRRTVEETVVHHFEQEIRVTISIGVSSYPYNDIENATELIELADKGLYKAKESGRNIVI